MWGTFKRVESLRAEKLFRKENIYFDEKTWENYLEKQMEAFLPKELISGKNFQLNSRQKRLTSGVADLIFEETNSGDIYCIELQVGTLDRYHMAKLVVYGHTLARERNRGLNLILMANAVSKNSKKADTEYCEAHGIELVVIPKTKCKEIIEDLNPDVNIVFQKPKTSGGRKRKRGTKSQKVSNPVVYEKIIDSDAFYKSLLSLPVNRDLETIQMEYCLHHRTVSPLLANKKDSFARIIENINEYHSSISRLDQSNYRSHPVYKAKTLFNELNSALTHIKSHSGFNILEDIRCFNFLEFN